MPCGFVLVLLTVVRRLGGHRLRTSIEADQFSELVAQPLELEHDLVRLTIRHLRRIAERWKDVEVEVERRLSGAPLAWRCEEEIARTRDLLGLPRQLVGPDADRSEEHTSE